MFFTLDTMCHPRSIQSIKHNIWGRWIFIDMIVSTDMISMFKIHNFEDIHCWRQPRPLNQHKLVSPIAKTIIKCKQSISGEHECKTSDKIWKFCCVCCASNVHARVTLWLAVCDTDSSQRTSQHPQLPNTQPTAILSYTNIFTQEDSTTQDLVSMYGNELYLNLYMAYSPPKI